MVEMNNTKHIFHVKKQILIVKALVLPNSELF